MDKQLYNEQTSIQMTFGFFVYLSFSVIVLTNDYYTWLLPNSFYGYSLSISTGLVLLFSTILIRIKVLQICHIKSFAKGNRWVHLLGIIIIWSFTLIKIAFPDSSYDVYNYHLYFQQLFNRDFVQFDFFPIRAVNAFYFILGDRMNYVFRFFLGYRLGTVLNSFVITIIYYQLIKFIRICFGIRNQIVCMIAATIGLLTENVIWQYCSYMVDLLAVPFLLELLMQIVSGKRSNCIYLCLLTGLALSIKISNVFFILPIAVYYIVLYYKSIRIYELGFGILCCFITVCVYLALSYHFTQNPVFPYANGLFKSRYFSLTDSPMELALHKARYGAESFWQYLFWPVYSVIHPERTNEFSLCTGRTLVVFISLVLYFVLKKGKLRKIEWLVICQWLSMYFINVLLFDGYSRYIPLLDILGGVYIVLIIYCLFYSVEKGFSWRLLSIFLSCSVLIQTTVLLKQYLVNNVEWSWRNNFFTDSKGYLENAKLFIRDRDDTTAMYGENIEEWFAVDYNGSVAALLDNSVPIVGLRMSSTNDYTERILRNKINDVANKTVFSYSTPFDMDSCLDCLSENGLSIEEIQTIPVNFTDVRYPLSIIKLSNSISNVKYEHFSTIDGDSLTNGFALGESSGEVNGFVSFAPIATGWGSDGFIVSLVLYDSERNYIETIAEDYLKPNEKWTSFHIQPDYCNGQYFIGMEISNLVGCNDIGDWYDLILCYESIES